MKDKERDKPQEGESSRRGFIKTGIVGLAVSAAVPALAPVAHALAGKQTVALEQSLIERTVGRSVRLLMDPDVTEAPDFAMIYKGLGGRNEFTTRLLGETFGSRSMGQAGILQLAPNTPPDLKAMTKALEDKAAELVSKKVAGLGATPVSIVDKKDPGAVWAFGGSTITVKCH